MYYLIISVGCIHKFQKKDFLKMKNRFIIYTSIVVMLLLMITITACGAQTPVATEAGSQKEETTKDKAEKEENKEAADEDAANVDEDKDAETTQVESGGQLYEDEGIVTETGLRFIEIEAGDGESPEPGDTVVVHYTGTLTDGTKFDSSVDRGQPFEFVLGQGQVISGWDEGIAMLKEGGKAKLVIPSELGYGAGGAGEIPPNATLIFDVELVSIQKPVLPTEVDPDDLTTTDSGLQYYDLEEGDGPVSETGQKVTVHYTGWLEDGTKFDSSLDREPFQFVLGAGRVIPGWDEGVAGMNVGTKRQLVIPSDLAYGDSGAGVIPPGATLIFEVELLGVEDGPPPPPESPTEVDEADYTTTESGLKYYDFEEGDGASPESGQMVVVNYTGWLEDGTLFDSSLLHGEPFSFSVGVGQVIPGWDEGVADMKVGGKRQLVVPPDLAYGESGTGDVIPPNATLIFEVELLEVQ
jgi:peptidylprolyl isomerase